MGCAASASGKAVPPQAGRGTGDKRKDAQTTYRERLGEDFMKDFAKSKHVIRETSTKSPNGSTVSAASTRAYTFDDDCIATGTLISPYTTPPTDSLPGAGAHVAGADVVDSDHPGLTSGSLQWDLSGPFVSASARVRSRASSREGSRLALRPGTRESTSSRPGSRESAGGSLEKGRGGSQRPLRSASRPGSHDSKSGSLAKGRGGSLKILSSTTTALVVSHRPPLSI